MLHISSESLESLPARISYLREFIGFTSEDALTLHAARSVVAPLIPAVVQAVYDKLLSFDITAKAFIPRQTGYDGELPTTVEDLTQDHPMIQFRKDFLSGYLAKLVMMDYEDIKSWEYLDKVGLMHTGQPGFKHRIDKPELRVELIHCQMLLGYVEDILVNAVLTHPNLDAGTKTAVLRAFNKVIWIQNDLFARHYVSQVKTVQPVSHGFLTNLTCTVPSLVLCVAAFLFVSSGYMTERSR